MEIRLNKFLAQAGVCSRREADHLIEDARVRVNGRVVEELGQKIDTAKDRVDVDGRTIRAADEKPLYVLLYKPAGYVVTVKDPYGRPTVMKLLSGLPGRVFPVGRLDVASEGVLLLTNDGETAYRLTHPRFEIEKTYLVKVKGNPADRDLDKLRKGIFLEGKKTAPARIRVLRRSPRRTHLRITLHEGRKREIRKMFEALGHSVEGLLRIQFAGLTLEGLKPGQWRYLNKREVRALTAKGA